jgi:lipopolysaccharide/colanic/teichoic acid biosynthesis glycosyltransferase
MGRTSTVDQANVYLKVKRAIDIVVSAAAIVVLLPLLVPVMIALRLTGEGEVFYRQRRLGHGNRPFGILKFATMLKDSPNMKGGEITLSNDPRLLPFGRILRLTKINELPQLVNVLRGEMSLVGPRPLLEVSFRMYAPDVRAVVYQSMPGLTGIGSLLFRDEVGMVSRADMDPRAFYAEHIYPYKGELELWYFRNRSLRTDLLILLLTAWYVVFPESALVWRVFRELPQPASELRLSW